MHKDVFNSKVLPLLLASIFVMMIGSVAGLGALMLMAQVGMMLFWGLIIVEIILIIAIHFLRRNFPINLILLFLFVFITGITLTPLLLFALSQNIFIVPLAFGITFMVMGGLTAYVYVTGHDFTSWGPALFIMLLGAILMSIIGWFLKFALMDIVLDIVILVLFMGFVLYDTSKILKEYDDRDYVAAVLSLYIDFVNILVRILSLLSGGRRRR